MATIHFSGEKKKENNHNHNKLKIESGLSEL